MKLFTTRASRMAKSIVNCVKDALNICKTLSSSDHYKNPYKYITFETIELSNGAKKYKIIFSGGADGAICFIQESELPSVLKAMEKGWGMKPGEHSAASAEQSKASAR